MSDIPDQKLPLPRTAPVMVLPGAVLFPQALLPLMIFEPRYRAMLAEALDQQRMFCIALLKPELTDWSSPDDFHHIAGVGLIRACVEHEDGTSHLVLQGLARVEFVSFPQTHPFVVAEIRELPTVDSGTLEIGPKVREIREHCAEYAKKGSGAPAELEQQLASVTDAGVLGDLLANSLVHEAARRQEVLETLDAAERLAVLLRHLETERAE